MTNCRACAVSSPSHADAWRSGSGALVPATWCQVPGTGDFGGHVADGLNKKHANKALDGKLGFAFFVAMLLPASGMRTEVLDCRTLRSESNAGRARSLCPLGHQ